MVTSSQGKLNHKNPKGDEKNLSYDNKNNNHININVVEKSEGNFKESYVFYKKDMCNENIKISNMESMNQSHKCNNKQKNIDTSTITTFNNNSNYNNDYGIDENNHFQCHDDHHKYLYNNYVKEDCSQEDNIFCDECNNIDILNLEEEKHFCNVCFSFLYYKKYCFYELLRIYKNYTCLNEEDKSLLTESIYVKLYKMYLTTLNNYYFILNILLPQISTHIIIHLLTFTFHKPEEDEQMKEEYVMNEIIDKLTHQELNNIDKVYNYHNFNVRLLCKDDALIILNEIKSKMINSQNEKKIFDVLNMKCGDVMVDDKNGSDKSSGDNNGSDNNGSDKNGGDKGSGDNNGGDKSSGDNNGSDNNGSDKDNCNKNDSINKDSNNKNNCNKDSCDNLCDSNKVNTTPLMNNNTKRDDQTCKNINQYIDDSSNRYCNNIEDDTYHVVNPSPDLNIHNIRDSQINFIDSKNIGDDHNDIKGNMCSNNKMLHVDDNISNDNICENENNSKYEHTPPGMRISHAYTPTLDDYNLIQNMSKVRSTLRQFVRDWSMEGQEERDKAYIPLLKSLDKYLPINDIYIPKILCPGSGLGRLPYEIAKKGYRSQGNEFSYFMLLGSNFILNYYNEKYSLSIHPYCLCTSNRRSRDDHLKIIQLPDVNTYNKIVLNTDFSMCAGELIEVYYNDKEYFDGVLTCFFLDTAKNIFMYIRTFASILKPNSLWSNIGPLLYHYAEMPNEMSIELAWDEIQIIISKWFIIKEIQWIDNYYTTNFDSMMQVQYHCVFFSAIRNDIPVD
ncbi:N2227-like protein, putative [Plasmodium sp. gorilla clade G3]|nr:N2227-like protein, putative [Plasmodium sp. gorilla clade G3]